MSFVITINKSSFERLKHDVSEDFIAKFMASRKILTEVLDIEIIFDQVIESYWEYKNKVDYWRMRSISKCRVDYVHNHEIRSSLNRLAFNVLNLSKLYLDKHYNKDKKLCFSYDITQDQNVKNQIVDHRQLVFSENINYVIGCKLRSSSQHSSLPVSNIKSNFEQDNETLKQVVNFYINYDYKDLIKMGVSAKLINENISKDLTEILDGYIYAITSMHELNRKLTRQKVIDSKCFIQNILHDIIPEAECSEYFCDVFTQDNRKYSTDIPWFTDVIDYLNGKHAFSVDYENIKFGN